MMAYNDKARLKFTLGQRVRLSQEGVRIMDRKRRTARIVGWSRSPLAVRVLIDGLTCPQTWHIDFWEAQP